MKNGLISLVLLWTRHLLSFELNNYVMVGQQLAAMMLLWESSSSLSGAFLFGSRNAPHCIDMEKVPLDVSFVK